LFTASVAQADIVIDAFDSNQAVEADGPMTASDSLNPAGVLGGERDISVTVTSGGYIGFDVNLSNLGSINYNADGGTTGKALIVYDGADASPAINYTGLGGVSLTVDGADRFNVGLTSDLGATVVITVYTDATHFSTATVAENVAGLSEVLFSSFAQGAGAAGPADFVSVGAITILIDAPIAATDAVVNYFATGSPVPPQEVPTFQPLSPGYWKNHAWPVTGLTLGSQTYTQAELLKIMAKPGGDASTIMAFQLIAAKLNLLSGADPAPISGLVFEGDTLLSLYPGKLPYKVKTSSTIGKQMTGVGSVLSALWF